uniref:Pre-mRNA-processing factor 6 n=1 Tax=Auxenochlorella protothecoides TaxID=3075 RepID=A0A1D2A2C6_AUXPR
MSIRPASSRPPQAPGAKIDFNALRAPANYVPGLGRGAAGFTTRSDIGPSMPAPDMASQGGDDDSKFDEFLGNDGGVLAGTGAYDDEDREADAVWDQVEDRMDERRREHRDARMKEELERFRAANPRIGDLFTDLKRGLAELDASAWEAIPEIGDTTVKRARRAEIFTPVPDSLLARAAATAGDAPGLTSLDPGGVGPGTETPGAATSLTAIGAGRSTVVQLKLDRLSDSVTGQTVVDPRGYLTDLKSVTLKSDAEISDIKKARLLLKSVIKTNPAHGPGWVAAARLEEVAGKLPAARELALKGCELAPGYVDVWLEAARLQEPENAKAILARGVAALPEAVTLWMAAAKLETSDEARKRVLLRALERIPQSVRLWKAVVEISDEDDARILLSRAVECCPQHVELWLALARLESYKNAQKVLNRARQAIPTSAEVWITAAKLEESAGQAEAPAKIIPRGLKSLQANGVVLDREWWLHEAEAAERTAPPLPATCRAIVAAVVDEGVEAADRKRTWVADAEEALRRGAVETARAILAAALAAFPGKKSVWRRAAALEKLHGTPEQLDALLRRAVQYCPQAEVLWLMAAKERWRGGDVGGARAVLEEAFLRNPDSEEIWLAAFKVEFESRELDRARMILARAREHPPASTQRVWMKSAIVEREAGDAAAEAALLEEGLTRFPTAWKLHLMAGALAERQGEVERARAAYHAGIKRCLDCVPLWIAAAALEEREGALARARALLEQARLKNPGQPALWLAAARTEARAGNVKAAEAVLARALQACPDSGAVWAESIRAAPRPARRSRSVDALKRCNDDPAVVAAVAQLFWGERKVEKARSWFDRAVTLDPDVGDHWALYLRFEAAHGTPEAAAAVLERAVAAEPRHGERWQALAKDPVNAHQPLGTLLKKLAQTIEKDMAM